MWTDKGTEFYNQQVKGVLTTNNVALYSTENEEKSSVVERWNRTKKNITWKYFTANNAQKYIDVLPGMVERYNNTYHRSIKLKPTDARKPANCTYIMHSMPKSMLEKLHHLDSTLGIRYIYRGRNAHLKGIYTRLDRGGVYHHNSESY